MLKELNESFIRQNLKLTDKEFTNMFETIGYNPTVRQLCGYMTQNKLKDFLQFMMNHCNLFMDEKIEFIVCSAKFLIPGHAKTYKPDDNVKNAVNVLEGLLTESVDIGEFQEMKDYLLNNSLQGYVELIGIRKIYECHPYNYTDENIREICRCIHDSCFRTGNQLELWNDYILEFIKSK